MDQKTPDADTLTFAKALLGWMGGNATTYAEEKAKAFLKADDLPAARAWARVAGAIHGLDPALSPRQATVLQPVGRAQSHKHRQSNRHRHPR